MSRNELPVHTRDSFPDECERRDVTIHGILLAAGTSTRYGATNKLLEPVDGKPILRHATEAIAGGPLNRVTVVVGHEAGRIRGTVEDLDVTIRENDTYGEGLSTSLRTGLVHALEVDSDAAVIALGDMPWVETTTYELLVDAYERGVADILVAAYEGQPGNPVLFDDKHFEDLLEIDGDVGGRQLLTESNGAVAIETNDKGVLRDVDSPRDIQYSG